ncbi:MAG: hypothetical protein U0R44_04475 [Candidatus Micrarchaeia archaeon]
MSKPGLRGPEPPVQAPKPTPETRIGPPRVKEIACGEITLPVWDIHGGPKAEPPKR